MREVQVTPASFHSIPFLFRFAKNDKLFWNVCLRPSSFCSLLLAKIKLQTLEVTWSKKTKVLTTSSRWAFLRKNGATWHGFEYRTMHGWVRYTKPCPAKCQCQYLLYLYVSQYLLRFLSSVVHLVICGSMIRSWECLLHVNYPLHMPVHDFFLIYSVNLPA